MYILIQDKKRILYLLKKFAKNHSKQEIFKYRNFALKRLLFAFEEESCELSSRTEMKIVSFEFHVNDINWLWRFVCSYN